MDVVAEEAPEVVADRWAVLLADELAQSFAVGVVEVVEECGQVVEGSFIGLFNEGDFHAVVEAHQQSCEQQGIFVDWFLGDIFQDFFNWILKQRLQIFYSLGHLHILPTQPQKFNLNRHTILINFALIQQLSQFVLMLHINFSRSKRCKRYRLYDRWSIDGW